MRIELIGHCKYKPWIVLILFQIKRVGEEETSGKVENTGKIFI